MLSAWRDEGVGTDHVVRVPGRLPGLHIIKTDGNGQRTFYYWRDSSPARQLFELPQTDALAAVLAEYDIIYLSGVTLSLYGEAGRKRLFEALDLARARGRRIAFDTNFRTRGWPDRALAKAAFRAAIGRAAIVLASTEDLDLLFGADGASELPTSNPRHRGGAQARRAGGPYLPWRQAADDRCRAGRRRRSTPRPRATALPPPIWRRVLAARSRPPQRCPATGWRARSCATAARSFPARRCRPG